MRVVKKAPGPTSKELDCDGCGATLEVEAADLTREFDHRDGNAVTFRCPECGRTNWVSVGVMPESVMKDVRR